MTETILDLVIGIGGLITIIGVVVLIRRNRQA
jgi:hypothetical protein